MSKNLKLMIFVLLMGLITSGLLLGASAITHDRIELNRDAKLKGAVLDGFEIAYTSFNIHEVFAENVTISEIDDFVFYIDDTSGRVAYEFIGGGLWGDIYGLVTLEADFETIAWITILKQEETPGLGGVVAERPYLNNFVGKKIDQNLEYVRSNATGDNQVDMITGATGTTASFITMLNASYQAHKPIWTGGSSLFQTNLKKAVLDGFNIGYTDETLNTVFDISVRVRTYLDKTFYIDTLTGAVAYQFSEEGYGGLIKGVMTLESDFETIMRIAIVEHGEQRGAGVIERDYLDQYNNQKIAPELFITVEPLAGATVGSTNQAMMNILTTSYQSFLDVWNNLPENEEIPQEYLEAILDGFGIAYTEANINDVFASNVTLKAKGSYVFFVENATQRIAYRYEVGSGYGGEIKGVMTLEPDFETIVRFEIVEHHEVRGAGVAYRDYLDQYIGEKITPELFFPIEPLAGATVGATTAAVHEILNESYQAQKAAWDSVPEVEELSRTYVEAILDGFGILYTEANVFDVFANKLTVKNQGSFTFYIEKTTQRVAYRYEVDNGYGGAIKGVMTLESDFETIVRFDIVEHHEVRGAGVAYRDYLDQYNGEKITPALFFPIEPLAGATVGSTTAAVHKILNESYQAQKAAWTALNE
ncbi:MAG: FMN-binding protein [Acholeplasmataceae bacterium]|nr:FMN-binding protein [Acholeplasmataceae bacterium]